MARRQVSIFVNGREVEYSLKAITKEKRLMNRELDKMVIGSTEYVAKMKQIRELDGIINAHRQNLRGVESTLEKVVGGVTRWAGVAAAAFSVDAIVRYGRELQKLSVEMQQADRVAVTVFGDSLGYVDEQARKNAESAGLSERQYRDLAAATADLLVPMGFQREQAAAMSVDMQNLSGALSEWTSGQLTSEQASTILTKALLGEREELKQLGVSISEADVQAKILEMGMGKLTGKAAEQAEALATLQLVTEKSADATTLYAQNTDSAVRAQAQMNATIARIRENLVERLTPALDAAAGMAGSLLSSFESLIEVPIEDKLREEQTELNVLVNRITDANVSQEKRNALIIQLQQQYPGFLGNLDAESVTNEQLAGRLAEVNNQYILKLALAKDDQAIQEAAATLADRQRDVSEKEIETQRKIVRIVQEYGLQVDLANKSLDERVAIVREELGILQAQQPSQAAALRYAREAAGLAYTGAQVLEGRLSKSKELLSVLQQERATLEATLMAQLGIASVETDITAPTAAIPTAPTADALAASEAARRAEQRKREAEKEAKELADQLQRLQDLTAEYREAERLARLTDDERQLEELRLKYDEQIRLAARLEAAGLKDATAQRIELERLRDDALSALQVELSNARLEEDLALQAEQEAKRQAAAEAYAQQRAAAEQRISEQLGMAIVDANATVLAQLDEQYQELFALAEQYEIDTLDLQISYAREKERIQAEFAEKGRRDLLARQKAEAEALSTSYRAFADIVGSAIEFISDESRAATQLSKALAIVQLGIKTAEGIASAIAAGAGLVFPANLPAIAAGVTAVLSNMAAARRILNDTPEVPQRYTGGWMSVRGEDDGRVYHAQQIGRPGTGILPDHPVLINSVTGGTVLGSERGREYFVANKDLQNPAVLNHVQAIDNIVSSRQRANGGYVTPADAPSASAIDTGMSAAMNALVATNARLIQVLESGIVAVLEDDTLLRAQDRIQLFKRAAGL